MRYLTVQNRTRGRVLGNRIAVADGLIPRLRGLLGRSSLDPGEGLLLTPCHAVHTVGMRIPVDVVLLDRRGSVVATYPRLGPGRVTRWSRRAVCALELPVGTIASTDTHLEDRLSWAPIPDDPPEGPEGRDPNGGGPP